LPPLSSMFPFEGQRMSRGRRSLHMPATGELIRLMNYVDDINATLRKITFSIAGMTEEERKRLSEYMGSAVNGMKEVLQQLDKSAR
jgi:hypothetical protein